MWRGGVATALYVPNVLFALDGVNYLSEATPPLFQHYWSLGIEEQFYVFWPLLLAVAFAVVKKPEGALVCGGSASEKSSYCAGGIGDVRGPGVRGERVLA